MSSLFEIVGEGLDVGYQNLRAGEYAAERELTHALDEMWSHYEPYADADFQHGFAHDVDGRFWELFLGCTLLDAGKKLLRRNERHQEGGQPDICVIDGDRRIWIEAIVPTRGENEEDRIRELVPLNEGGHFAPAPVRQVQLRITSALWTKSQMLNNYLDGGVIKDQDIRIIAIGAARFGAYARGPGFPLAISSVFPIGNEYIVFDPADKKVLEQGFEASFSIERRGGGGAIRRTAFLDNTFAHVSAILWSRVAVGNMSRADRPLSLIHNPRAVVPMIENWGVWDREFVTSPVGDGWQAVDILSDRRDGS